MEKYIVQPPQLEPVEVEAVSPFHAYMLAASKWRKKLLGYSSQRIAQSVEKKEAAPAVGAAKDGKEKTIQDQDTTVPARGQHVCGWFSECKCLCETCRRDFLDDDDNSCCLEHIGRSCPVTACPDYLPEEVTKG